MSERRGRGGGGRGAVGAGVCGGGGRVKTERKLDCNKPGLALERERTGVSATWYRTSTFEKKIINIGSNLEKNIPKKP